MLTCKVGESIVNCIDCTYDRYQLKIWSNKGILKCPVCNRDYEYCHGEVVPPYFRHKDKECSGYYTEPETEEHKNGKTLLYEWLKNQSGIENLQLEAWIPETKQRPDIYFEQNGKRYVIEYQCTPIASEYIKRRELYKLNNITDIWILGTEKYSVEIDYTNNRIEHSQRMRSIEKETMNNGYGLIYLDSSSKTFLFDFKYLNKIHSIHSWLLEDDRDIREYYIKNYSSSNLKKTDKIFLMSHTYNSVSLDLNSKLTLADDVLIKIETIENEIYDSFEVYEREEINKRKVLESQKQAEKNIMINVVSKLNKQFIHLDEDYLFTSQKGYSGNYKYRINFMGQHTFFIKENYLDFCSSYHYSKPVYYNRKNAPNWESRTGYDQISSERINSFCEEEIYECILGVMKSHILSLETEKEKRFAQYPTLSDLRELEISIVDSDYIIPDNIRFRYLKQHDFYDTGFIINEFANEVRRLKNKKEIVFLLKGSNVSETVRKILVKQYGFKKVNILSNCAKR